MLKIRAETRVVFYVEELEMGRPTHTSASQSKPVFMRPASIKIKLPTYVTEMQSSLGGRNCRFT
jgi:hypothetical protein